MSAHENSFSQFEVDEMDDEWFTLTAAWKARAEKAEATAALLLAALQEAEVAMNHMGDDLNDRDFDAGESEHFEEVCFAFHAVRAALTEAAS